jgi:hypothetical protein
MYNVHMMWKTEGFLYNDKNNIGTLVFEPVSEQVEAAVAVEHTSCKQRIPETMAARSEKKNNKKRNGAPEGLASGSFQARGSLPRRG